MSCRGAGLNNKGTLFPTIGFNKGTQKEKCKRVLLGHLVNNSVHS